MFGCLGLLGLCCLLGVVLSLVGGNGDNGTRTVGSKATAVGDPGVARIPATDVPRPPLEPTNTPEPTRASAPKTKPTTTPTAAPTDTPVPTRTPTAVPTDTPTPVPTPTPTAVPADTPTPTPITVVTPQSRLPGLVEDAAIFGHEVTVRWVPETHAVMVKDNVGDYFSAGTARTMAQDDTFQIMKAVYTESGLKPAVVVVEILAPLQDQYGNDTQGRIALARLERATAAKFSWKNLYSVAAWDLYDETFLHRDMTE